MKESWWTESRLNEVRADSFFFFLDFHSKACFLCGSCSEASNCFLEAGSHSSVSPAKKYSTRGRTACVCVCVCYSAFIPLYTYVHYTPNSLITAVAHVAHVVLLECLSALQGIIVFVTGTGTHREDGGKKSLQPSGRLRRDRVPVFKPLKRCFHCKVLRFSMDTQAGADSNITLHRQWGWTLRPALTHAQPRKWKMETHDFLLTKHGSWVNPTMKQTAVSIGKLLICRAEPDQLLLCSLDATQSLRLNAASLSRKTRVPAQICDPTVNILKLSGLFKTDQLMRRLSSQGKVDPSQNVDSWSFWVCETFPCDFFFLKN